MILAGFYTNNRLRPQLLQQSLRHFQAAARNGPVIPIVSSWEPIPDLTCPNVVSHFRLPGFGHLNILLQLMQIIHSCHEPWDFFACCEHDCLYPEDYFATLAARTRDPDVAGVASENHVGLRPYGYSHCTPNIHPLFAMAVRRDRFLQSLDLKLKECVLKGSCCIEPDDRTDWLFVGRDDPNPPVLHVNMDTTSNNHHLTNHCESYTNGEIVESHPYWGDGRRFGVFTDEEIRLATTPLLPPGTYRILQAQYGDFATGRVVSFLPALERVPEGGYVHVSNAQAGCDPAPGVVKAMRLEVHLQDAGHRTLEFREGVLFRL